jgi:hypothetical protein
VVTSRTGTAKYLRNSARVKRQARADGITHCPGYTDARGAHHPCGVELDYDVPLLPNSAETDHITEYRRGGTDDASNLRVLCRRQNSERNRLKPVVPMPSPDDFPTTRDWFAEGVGGGPRS